MANAWSVQEMEQYFFTYMEYTDDHDLLHALKILQCANCGMQNLATTLHMNLKATAQAATTPWYTAMLGTFGGRAGALRHFLENARESNDQQSIRSAIEVLKDMNAPLQQTFGVLQTIHERAVATEAFQALLRQASAMIWAAFETFASDVFCYLYSEDLRFLHQIVLVQKKDDPWGSKPRKLLNWIEEETKRDSTLTPVSAIASFSQSLALNLNAIRHFSKILFLNDKDLHPQLQSHLLANLSTRRHLLMHRAGIIDQEYLASTGETLPVGASLLVTPHDVRCGLQAVAEAGASLARAADALL